MNTTEDLERAKALLIQRYIHRYQFSENQYLRHRALELRGDATSYPWLIQRLVDAVRVPNGKLHYDLALRCLAIEIESELGVSRGITGAAIAYVLYGGKTK